MGKRRSAVPLSRDAVLAASVTLADERGLSALTMRSVAGALGVEAMSLYHHVKGKEAMLDGMVDLVFGEFYTPVPGGRWDEELRRRCISARQVLTRHPWAVGLLDSRRQAGFATLAHHDAVIGCLREAGFSLALTGHAVATIDAYLYGFLVQELSLPFEPGADLAELGEQLVAGIPPGTLEYLKEFTLEHALRPGYDFADEFEPGLDLLLDALTQRRSAQAGGAA